MTFLVESTRSASGDLGEPVSMAGSLRIGAAVVYDCDKVLAEQTGDVITIVYERTCGHVGMVQLQTGKIHGIEEAFRALKAAGTPATCFCMHPVNAAYAGQGCA